MIWLGWRKDLTYDDLSDLNSEDKAAVVASKFQRCWDTEIQRTQKTNDRRNRYCDVPVSIQNSDDEDDEVSLVSVSRRKRTRRRERRQSEPSLILALIKTFWPVLLSSAFFKFVQDSLNFVSPQILRLLINFTEDSTESDWKGYFYAMLLFVIAVIQSLFLHQYFHCCFTLGMRIRSAIVAAVYRKALCLNNKSCRDKTVGEIVNLMSVDGQRLMDLMSSLHMIWSAPFQIVLSLIFLYLTMGYAIFAGFALMILFIPFNAALAAKTKTYQVKLMAEKDSRVKLVNEILNGIKVIKLYAWEIPFKGQVQDIRQQELNVLKASAYINAATSFSWTCAPFLVSLVTFGTYTLINLHNPENQLTPDKAFVALSLFNILRFPLSMLPRLISSLVQASVSVKRVGGFLRSDELDPDVIDWRNEPATERESAVEVSGGTFTWTGESSSDKDDETQSEDLEDEETDKRDTGTPTLSNINLRVAAGQLVAIVGQVGAGKSSLISALLGEMDKLSGTVSLKGRLGYVPQQAWIQNGTIQSNILFGQPMKRLKYSETLNSCTLEPDLEILPGGDQAEIGEKGINFSGGQKQRVSLARAVYQDADIYLMDDPLSAVDSHVGKHIFEKVIGPEGSLRNKTHILVTHGINYLPQCDQIVVMTAGQISEIGSYNELITANGAFAEYIRVYSGTGDEDQDDDNPSVSQSGKNNLEQEQSGSNIHCHSPPSLDNFKHHSHRISHDKHMKSHSSESETKEEMRRTGSKEEEEFYLKLLSPSHQLHEEHMKYHSSESLRSSNGSMEEEEEEGESSFAMKLI